MREIQVCPPRRFHVEAIRRLEFRASGAELVAWIGVVLHTCTLRTGAARVLFDGFQTSDWIYFSESDSEIVLAPDGRLLATEYNPPGDDSHIYFEDLTDRNKHLLRVPIDALGYVGLMFTADGKELIAVWNSPNDGDGSTVKRFKLAALTVPPRRFFERVNPLTREIHRIPDLKWKSVTTLPKGKITCAVALSANERFVAAGTEEGTVHVADLKKKNVRASFPYPGQKLPDRAVVRVAFDPGAERVVMLANGCLFAHPLGPGKSWQTKDALGSVRDFAFHPVGHILCAVFADGQARFLDARTGAVHQSLRWAKTTKALYSVAFAPDGLTCAAGANGKVILWDVDL
jgi:WD40 repeat protein